MKGNENTARRSHPNLPPYGKGLTVSREVSPIQANPHFKDFVPLVRDYANQYDPNAIKVQIGDGLLGYVPRTEARLLAPRMDAGAAAAATVVAVDRELSNPQLSIEIIVESNQPSSG